MLFVVCCCCYDEFKWRYKNTDNGASVAAAVFSSLYCSAAVAVVEYHLDITSPLLFTIVGFSGASLWRSHRKNL
jgi:hypothetical protein